MGSSSLKRGWAWAPCVGRWMLNHWTTREVPKSCFDLKYFFASFKILRYLMVIMIAVEEIFQFSSVSYEWVKVTQLCPTLCDPMDCTVHGILQATILEEVDFPLSRGSSPTQGLNPGLPHCRQILYQLSHQGSPLVVIRLTYFITNLRWSLLWLTDIFWMTTGSE